MRRKKINPDKIIKRATGKLNHIYSDSMIDQVGREVLSAICEELKEGSVVDFGIGNTYLKLRKNNAVFSPEKTHAIVMRGDVHSEIANPIIDKALGDTQLFEMLYTRRGVTE